MLAPRPTYVTQAAASPFAAALAPDVVAELRAATTLRRYRRGEVVFHRGDPADTLHVVERGRFAVQVVTPLGDTTTLAVLGPGECFGELALLADRAPRSATVVALDDGMTYALHEAELARLRRERPSVDAALIAVLVAQVQRLSGRLVEVLHVDAERRVRRRLLDVAAQSGSDAVSLRQEDLAQLAGTSRATVNRVLRADERNGLLTLSRGRVTLVDHQGLAERAR